MALFLVLSLLLLLKLPPRQLNSVPISVLKLPQSQEERTPSLPLKTKQPLPSTPSCMEIRLLSSHFSTELRNKIKDRSVSTWKKKDQGVGDIARFPLPWY